jgi:prevent-host-death family protein
MEMSVREARAQFATALAAAERGERVTITKNGKPVAELGPPAKANRFDWDRLDQVRRETGLDKVVLNDGWQERFDAPSFSREILGLPDSDQ